MWIIQLLVITNLSFASQDWSRFIDQVTQLRGEIELLSKDTESQNKNLQSEIDSLAQKKNELSSQLMREKFRGKQLQAKVQRLQMKTKTQPSADPKSSQLMLSWIKSYQDSLTELIPFKQEARKAQLQKIAQRLESGLESHESLMVDFWTFLENEKKLSETNSYQILDIEVEGQLQKCEVARLGLKSLFAITPSQKMLQAELTSEGWKWKDIKTQEQKKSILSLVDHLKNRNTSILYVLPINQQPLGASL